jgi:hypothetical protein
MNRTIAGVVVALFAISGCTTGQGVASGAGVASLTPPPSLSPSPSQSTAEVPIGSIPPGTYVISDGCCVGTKPLYLTVPAGWETFDPAFVSKHPSLEDGFGLIVEAWRVGNVYADPCHRAGSGLKPAVGPTVDDLATALAKENGPNASAITDVTLGGYPARKIVLTVPKGLDLATCQDKSYSWWSHPDEPGGWGPRIFFKPRVDTVYILDVEGTRQVVNAGNLPNTTAADRAELEQVVASIRFEP